MKSLKIHFKKEAPSGFYNTLKKRVDDLLIDSKKKADYWPGVKAIILLIMYAISIVMIFTLHHPSAILSTYIILGILTTGIFLNVVHDAAHNALFKNNFLNSISIKLLLLFGTDPHIWKRRHIVSHHSYPNVSEKDYDIRQSNLIRVLPNTPFLAHHSYQPYYVPLLYLFYTLNWFFNRDFTDAFKYADELHVNNNRKALLVVNKIIYLFLFIALPSLLSGVSIWIFVTGFFLMHFSASLFGVMALTTAHVNHDSEFPEPDENGMMPDSWAMHQLRVTQDFATNNLIVTSCLGGFNFHLAHHLFPSIQHRHYKRITQIIKSTAVEFGVEYKCKSLGSALWSHYILLVNNSRQPIEIDM